MFGVDVNLAVLLLQGPLGPFFNRLSLALEKQGQKVFKINFNGGDRFFYSRKGAVDFTGTIDQWPNFLLNFMIEFNITSVFIYGDCRYYHYEAKRICIANKVKYFAFEEGYLRPNYITFEEGGVNGHSPITHSSVEAFEPIHEILNERKVPGNFIRRVYFATAYYVIAFLLGYKFSNYVHHRSFNPAYEAFCWWRGFIRKVIYKAVQGSAKKITDKGAFFLVPLQVHNDAQIEFHSQYESMQDFIVDVMDSFSKSGSKKSLIFKHHPMDRGHVNYSSLIKRKAAEFSISEQVDYIHDQHLPTLLKSCKGVVTINSTTALQAFYHGAPVFVMGFAFFDMPGLTYQGALATFWGGGVQLDSEFSDRFRAYIVNHGQINGSFYSAEDLTISNLEEYMAKLDLLGGVKT